MLIQVTQDDIDKGKPIHGRKCPLALAIRRQCTGNDLCVYAGWTWHNQFMPFAKLPKAAYEWYTEFDAGRPVPPFTFELIETESRTP